MMLTETFRSIAAAAQKVFSNWRSTLLLVIVYASLLASLYLFVSIREASIAQVGLTFALAIAAPVLFFVLQSIVATDTEQLPVGSLLQRSLINFWKLVLISLPLIALGILAAYLLGKAQAHFAANVNDAAAQLPHPPALARTRVTAKPIDWRAATLSTVRYLTFGLFLPLAAIHLWLATAREGLGQAILKLGRHLRNAFAPQSILVYIAGFLIFGVAPYFLLFRSIPSKHAWLEISLLVARLAVVFALTLFGWVITVKALWLLSNRSPAATNEGV
jgi:hypothetical protein